MRVKNVNATAYNTCRCGSWLGHWQKFSGQALGITTCAEETCQEWAEVGAHVQKENFADRAWYIALLCNRHNAQRGGSLDLDNDVKLVSANVALTCGS